MDVDGTPLAGLVILITLEDAIGGDGDLLAVGDVVALIIKELEVLPVVEPVRVFIACVETTLEFRPCQEPFWNGRTADDLASTLEASAPRHSLVYLRPLDLGPSCGYCQSPGTI